MRCAFTLFVASLGAVLIFGAALAAEPPAASTARSSTKAAAKAVRKTEWWTPKNAPANPERMYRVECVVFERGEDGKDQVISRPTIATVAHQPAQVQIAQATPLVTSVEAVAGGAAKPNVTVITTGVSMVLKLAPDQPGRAAFDVAIERTAIESVDVTKLADGSSRQSARIGSQTTRVIECIELGKKITIGLDVKDAAKSKRRAEFTVTEVTAEQPAK